MEITHILQNIFITDLHHIIYNSKDKDFYYKSDDRLYNCGFLEKEEITQIPVNYSDHRSVEEQIADNTAYALDRLVDPYFKSKSGEKLINILI